MNHISARELLQRSLDFIDQCSADIDNDKDVNLDIFETQVRQLCQQVNDMGRDRAKDEGFDEGLKNLGDKLAALQDKMKKRQDEIRIYLENLNKQQRAQAAYRKTSKNDK